MGQLLSRFRPAAVAPRPPEISSEGPPDPAASKPRDEDKEASSRRRRIRYSREFLLSVRPSCTSLPVGFDASKLSELSQLVETGSRAPLDRWRGAESRSNQPDRHQHPGNQCRHNWQWQRKEHDGLPPGSGTLPRSTHYVGSLASNGQGSECQLAGTGRNAGGYQPTRQYKAPPVPEKNVDSLNAETFGSFENWSKDRVEEERQRKASFELMRKEQLLALQEKKKAPDSDKLNLLSKEILQLKVIISSLHDSAGKRDPPTKSDRQGGLRVSFHSKEDAIKTAPLPPTPTTSQLKQLGFTNGLPQRSLPIQSFNTSHKSEIQILNTQDMMVSNAPESSISAQWFPGGGTLGQDGANFGQKKLEIQLPGEDALFPVNDFLSYTQNTDQWSAAEWARAEGQPGKDEAPDMNSRFQSLDVSGSHFNDQIDPNNLYQLFGTRPDAESAKRNAGAISVPSRPSDRNRQAPFDMPKATRHGADFPFPQHMKSVQGVRAAPGVPCPAARHHVPQPMTMPGSSLPPQGFPICAPHLFYCRTEMAGADSSQKRRCEPGYGETGMTMAGPPGAEGEVNQAGAFDRPVQMKQRGRSRRTHPELAGPARGFYEHFRR